MKTFRDGAFLVLCLALLGVEGTSLQAFAGESAEALPADPSEVPASVDTSYLLLDDEGTCDECTIPSCGGSFCCAVLRSYAVNWCCTMFGSGTATCEADGNPTYNPGWYISCTGGPMVGRTCECDLAVVYEGETRCKKISGPDPE